MSESILWMSLILQFSLNSVVYRKCMIWEKLKDTGTAFVVEKTETKRIRCESSQNLIPFVSNHYLFSPLLSSIDNNIFIVSIWILCWALCPSTIAALESYFPYLGLDKFSVSDIWQLRFLLFWYLISDQFTPFFLHC